MQKITKFLVKIVKKAQKLVTDEFQVKAKGCDGDLVTNFDYAIEKFLIGKIKKQYPNFDIVSEEFNSDNKVTKNCFMIDPIDGTINFAHKLPFWVIQVGAMVDGKMVSSVIAMPKLKRIYYADQDGAFMNGKQIHVEKTEVKNTVYAVEGGERGSFIVEMQKFARHCRVHYCCGVDYCFTASGEIGGVLFKKDNPWDYMAGQYLVECAGGVSYSKKGCHIVANTKEMLQSLKKAYNASEKAKKETVDKEKKK